MRLGATDLRRIGFVLEEIEEAAEVTWFIVCVVFGTGIQFRQRLAGIFPVYFCALKEKTSSAVPVRDLSDSAVLTCGSTSRSHENSSIDSTMPSASGVSLAAAGGGKYLYSFFNTLSVKCGFSLKV